MPTPLAIIDQPDQHSEFIPQTVPQQTVRVLHVVNGEHFSGAERVQMHLAHCFPKFQVRADFACLKPGKFVEQFNALESRVLPMPMRGRFDVTAGWRLAERVRAGSYQLLHAHTPRSAMVTSIASRLTGVPWVYHVHSPAARDSSRGLVNRVNDLVERASLSNCAHLITVSRSLCQEMIRQGWSDSKVTVVHNGVPTNRRPRKSRPDAPKGADLWTIGMVALIRPRKGLEVLLEALRLLLDEGLTVKLKCVGPFETAEYEQSIRQRVQALRLSPHLEFTGFTKDVAGALASLDVMVLPSLYGEGLPMVVLEAMAAGVPVVATKVEGTPEAIRHGVEGLLAEPNSSRSLADQLGSLIRGAVSWEALSQQARTRHAESFSDQAMAQGVAQVYRRLLS